MTTQEALDELIRTEAIYAYSVEQLNMYHPLNVGPIPTKYSIAIHIKEVPELIQGPDLSLLVTQAKDLIRRLSFPIPPLSI